MGEAHFVGELRHRRMHLPPKPWHFSRTELVRGFIRTDVGQLPTVYEVRMSGGE